MSGGEVEVLSAELGDADGLFFLFGSDRRVAPDLGFSEEGFLSDIADIGTVRLGQSGTGSERMARVCLTARVGWCIGCYCGGHACGLLEPALDASLSETGSSAGDGQVAFGGFGGADAVVSRRQVDVLVGQKRRVGSHDAVSDRESDQFVDQFLVGAVEVERVDDFADASECPEFFDEAVGFVG